MTSDTDGSLTPALKCESGPTTTCSQYRDQIWVGILTMMASEQSEHSFPATEDRTARSSRASFSINDGRREMIME